MSYRHAETCNCPSCEIGREETKKKQNNCPHRRLNGELAVKYDSSYEMNPNHMFCELCGKEGKRQELCK